MWEAVKVNKQKTWLHQKLVFWLTRSRSHDQSKKCILHYARDILGNLRVRISNPTGAYSGLRLGTSVLMKCWIRLYKQNNMIHLNRLELQTQTYTKTLIQHLTFTIPRYYRDVNDNSFFPCTARLWNSLPIEYFPLTYDLNSFKFRINRHPLAVGSF